MKKKIPFERKRLTKEKLKEKIIVVLRTDEKRERNKEFSRLIYRRWPIDRVWILWVCFLFRTRPAGCPDFLGHDLKKDTYSSFTESRDNLFIQITRKMLLNKKKELPFCNKEAWTSNFVRVCISIER